VYAHPFSYHRAGSLLEASKLLQQLGEDARLIAGGQSLIPLMKMRMNSSTVAYSEEMMRMRVISLCS
jgi:CO/xanthine dehydrogenase FAD-binding subunit